MESCVNNIITESLSASNNKDDSPVFSFIKSVSPFTCHSPGRAFPPPCWNSKYWVSRWSGWNVTVQDRKSTRLNSSHANISYAVFCLKKKTPANGLPVDHPDLSVTA